MKYVHAYMMTYPLRAVAPLSYAAILFWSVLRPSLGYTSLGLLLWALVEVVFHLYYLSAKQRLQARGKPSPLSPSERSSLFSQIIARPDAGSLLPGKWFEGAASLEDIGRGDLCDWLAWAFFASPLSEMASDDLVELNAMADAIESTGGVRLKAGKTGVKVLRLNLDDVPSLHRPLVCYLAIEFVNFLMGTLLRVLGFQRTCVHGLTVWARIGAIDARHPPIVFVHGVGIGLFTYISFLYRLARESGGRTIVLFELPHVSMRLGYEDCPRIKDIVTATEEIFDKYRLPPARWVGHSLGTFVCAAMIKDVKGKTFVGSCVMIDPVCFLLYESDVIYNFCVREPETPFEVIRHYHVSQELHIRNYFGRNFWWYECVLFADDVKHIDTEVFLAEVDGINNAARIGKYLEEHRIPSHTFPGYSHAQWLLDSAANDMVLKAVLR